MTQEEARTHQENGSQEPPLVRRKRGRLPTACSQCHSRKQKCNNERPCLNCARRGVPDLCHPVTDIDNQERAKRRPIDRITSSAEDRLNVNDSTEISGNDVPSVETRDCGSTTSPWEVESQCVLIRPAPQLMIAPELSSPQVGQLWNSRGAPTYYGNSYFGPQVAARLVEGQVPEIPIGVALPSSSQSFRNETGPFSQLWDLLGMLPRQKSRVDHLTDLFLTELNWCIDAVHPETFRNNYNKFWDRKFGFEDVTTVDLRWLALLFAILAVSELLDCPQPCSSERQSECEDASLRFYWASRRAIVIAPSFYGESSDLVRAGLLITRYLIYSRRLSESWLTIGFASRIAMAQGIHIDGERWNLPRKATETRRRLWSHLYSLDRMISLALGRPYAIAEQYCLTKQVTNLWVDEMSNEEALIAQPLPLTEPTQSVMSILSFCLAKIVGKIQEKCFGLDPPLYDVVLTLDRELLTWRDELPSYFALQNPDTSLDEEFAFLKWHRLYLHTSYHFTRIQLHRPYLLRSSITNRFQYSRNACMDSATIDLQARLSVYNISLVEKLQWGLGAHQLFNSALILGILAVKWPYSLESRATIEDLEAYCAKQTADPWMNEFGLAEVAVVQLCISQAKQKRRPGRHDMDGPPSYTSEPHWQPQPAGDSHTSASGTVIGIPTNAAKQHVPVFDPAMTEAWPGPYGSFPEAADLRFWEGLINEIGAD